MHLSGNPTKCSSWSCLTRPDADFQADIGRTVLGQSHTGPFELGRRLGLVVDRSDRKRRAAARNPGFGGLNLDRQFLRPPVGIYTLCDSDRGFIVGVEDKAGCAPGAFISKCETESVAGYTDRNRSDIVRTLRRYRTPLYLHHQRRIRRCCGSLSYRSARTHETDALCFRRPGRRREQHSRGKGSQQIAPPHESCSRSVHDCRSFETRG